MKTLSYYFLTLDIETSEYTEIIDGREIPTAVWLSYAYCNLYSTDGLRMESLYFREWSELKSIFNHYTQRFPNYRIYCFVHNLSYEFDFLIKNVSRPESILTNSSHHVISARLEQYPQIELRCTYMLSGKSLRALGEMVGLKKLESKYSRYVPADVIPTKEREYCVRDNDVCAKYVFSLLSEFETLRNIPYTKTGRVRKVFQKFYNQYYPNNDCDWDLYPPENCYQAMNDAFAGGCVFSNPLFTGRVMKNVRSYDITSSYPYAMLKEKFPYTIEKVDYVKGMEKAPFWIAKVRFNHIFAKYNWQWLSISKMNWFDVESSKWFNGKLVSSACIERTITSTDYEMILQTYIIRGAIEFLEFYKCEKFDYLPPPYIETIKVFGVRKYELKQKVKELNEDSPNFIDVNREYTLSKNDFNSIYGMSVQKIMQTEYDIDELYNWHVKEKKYKQLNKHLKRNFLFGVWITAYARRNLLRAIIKNCPDTFIYCDTDSIKFIGDSEFVDTNEPLQEEYLEIPALAKLGRFDYEGTYKEFLTYGAKKYAYTKHGHKNVYLTVAGLPKLVSIGKNNKIVYQGKTIHKLNTIREFRIGTVFKNCKLNTRYLYDGASFERDDDNESMVLDYRTNFTETEKFLQDNNINTCGGAALYPVDYELDMTKNDIKYCKRQEAFIESWQSSRIGTDWTKYISTKSLII